MEHAREYIEAGPVDMYNRLGHGLYQVEQRHGGTRIGICGLLKRDELDDVELGFAFLPDFWGKGYALESASAVMAYARDELGLTRVIAVTTPENHASIRLLEKLDFRFERNVRLDEEGDELRLFAYK
jgi:RimJ/RimL family protein N-acetyltransferase